MVLLASKKAINGLLGDTGRLAGEFHFFKKLVNHDKCPIDSKAIEECEAMFKAINRILYGQLAEIKHLQQMQICDSKADHELARAQGRWISASSPSYSQAN